MKRLMHTPWFLGEAIYEEHKDDLIEIIETNEYLFDEWGEMIPLTYHTKDNKVWKVTYKDKYEVEINPI